MKWPIGPQETLSRLDARGVLQSTRARSRHGQKCEGTGRRPLYFVSWCDLLMYCSARRIHQLASLRIRYLLFWIVDLVRERDTFFSLLPEKIG